MLSIYFILLLLTHHYPDNIRIPPTARSSGAIELQIVSVEKNVKNKSCLDVKVWIVNNTDTIASFFEDWNLWGWYNIYFKIKTIDSTYNVYKKSRDWVKNFPSYVTLFPGDILKLKYLLSEGSCDSTQFDNLLSEHGNKTISLQVFYKLDKASFPDSLIDHHFIYTRVHKKGQSVVIDSLKPPVQLIRTFPTTQLQSREHFLGN